MKLSLFLTTVAFTGYAIISLSSTSHAFSPQSLNLRPSTLDPLAIADAGHGHAPSHDAGKTPMIGAEEHEHSMIEIP
ncbi:MAG: hypothetical protein HC772_19690 [Leptolyngbyaceae cyanobacterium CRU_2_3]|nr:hypothetical protein [Leptolyngbyaceae cyanobacterium CRU_2_3]